MLIMQCNDCLSMIRECANNHYACVSLEFGILQSTNNKLHDRKTSFIFRTLRPPQTTARFFPAGVPDKGQKTPRR